MTLNKFLLPALFLFIVSCQSDNKPIHHKQADSEAGMSAGPEASVFSLTYFEVEDHAKWENAFNSLSPKRKSLGEKNVEVGTISGEPSKIYFMSEWTSVTEYNSLMKSNEYNAFIANCGLVGLPFSAVLNKLDSSAKLDNGVRSIIFHEVENYNTWKNEFAKFLPQRKAGGELSYEIGVLQGKSNIVYVLNEWESPESFLTFSSSEPLKNAMVQAGVKGTPTMLLLDQSPE